MKDKVKYGVTLTVMHHEGQPDSRHYVSGTIIVSVPKTDYTPARSFGGLHFVAYSPNDKTHTTRVQMKWYDDHTAAQAADSAKVKQKLASKRRGSGREISNTVLEVYDNTAQVEEALKAGQLRISMVDTRKMLSTIQTRMTTHFESDAMSFEERMEAKLAEAEDPVKREKELGIGEETAKKNPNWGLF